MLHTLIALPFLLLPHSPSSFSPPVSRPSMFYLMIHLYLFLILFLFISLSSYTTLKSISFDTLWLCTLTTWSTFLINSYICTIFALLFTFFTITNCYYLTTDMRLIMCIIITQFLILLHFTHINHIIIITVLFEVFSVSILLILISSRFGFKVLIIWYYYMINIITFIVILLLLYYMLLNYCYFLHDFCFLIFDEEWLGVMGLFYIVTILFKLYSCLLILFIEQLYIRLGSTIFIYMLTFYILFCFSMVIVLIAFSFSYIILIKLIITQTICCAVIGLNTFAIISLLFTLSVNNLSFIFLIVVCNKSYLFYVFLNFHFIYSTSLIILISLYHTFMVFNFFDYIYNETYFIMNFVFFSFFNSFTISLVLSTIFLCIGSIPILLGFFVKLFSLLLYLSYLGCTLIYFSLVWLIILYIFYFRLITNIFIFSYRYIGYFTIKFYFLHSLHLFFFFSVFIFILYCDLINLFDLIL